VQLSAIGERNLLRQRDQAGRGRKRNLAVSEESDRLLDLGADYDGRRAPRQKDHSIFVPEFSSPALRLRAAAKRIARVKRRIIGNR